MILWHNDNKERRILLEITKGNNIDNTLLEHFQQEIWSKVPHLEEKHGEAKVVNATPLIDITEDLKECAKNMYNQNLADTELIVFGKFDSNLLAGSIKVRPAVHIIHDAIVTGKLRSGQTIIEATSGNFGIALGQLSKLGLGVVTLVSRKLQEGVFEELRNENIRIMDLDMDICPAPGMKDNPNLLAAKATAANIRSQLSDLGFDPTIFDKASSEIQSLLASQDIINLAKFLAKIYGCFCPEQYDNELNVNVHRNVTAAEIDQQLHEKGNSLADFRIVCTFGTGGTSGGLSRYLSEKYGKKSLHVVFPLGAQDVAGIRTKDKKNLEAMAKKQTRTQISLPEAVSNIGSYDKIIWIHTQYTPREEGIELIAKSLGVDKSKISVPKARTAEQLLATQQIPEELSKDLQGPKGKSLLVCMAGNTSLMAVNVLAGKGIVTESLIGGITALPQGKSRQLPELIKVATE